MLNNSRNFNFLTTADGQFTTLSCGQWHILNEFNFDRKDLKFKGMQGKAGTNTSNFFNN